MHLFSRVLLPLCIVAVASCGDSEPGPDTAADARSETGVASTSAISTGGTIEATVGGEALSWNVLVDPEADGPSSSATHMTRGFGNRRLAMLTLNGYPGERPTMAGAITLTIGTTAEPGSCPCDVMSQTVELWDSPSRMYRTTDAQVTLESLEVVDVEGEVWRARGTFSGTLVPDDTFDGAEGPRPIEGSFSVEHIVPSPAGG